jgi:hypothetical protein
MRMKNNALWLPERAVELQLNLCVEAHFCSAGRRVHEATTGAIKELIHELQWRSMSKVLSRTVCTVSQGFLETNFRFRWVHGSMRRSSTRSSISTYATLGCQEMGSISTYYFSRMT